MHDAETVAAFLIERVRAARGTMWDEGAARVVPDVAPAGEALRVFAARRVRGVPEDVVRGLFAWGRGERPVDLLSRAIPTAFEVLARQARGRRCVSLLDDEEALAHGDPRHPDGLSFALHDLCHLEKFVAPEHHVGQVGFFRAVARAFATPAWRAIDDGLDDAWRTDRDYVVADMNGSAVFLFAALKMKVNMAVRRHLARERGRAAPMTGPLTDDERDAVTPALDVLFEAMDLPEDLRASARLVSTRRDRPAAARLLLDHFESRGCAGALDSATP